MTGVGTYLWIGLAPRQALPGWLLAGVIAAFLPFPTLRTCRVISSITQHALVCRVTLYAFDRFSRSQTHHLRCRVGIGARRVARSSWYYAVRLGRSCLPLYALVRAARREQWTGLVAAVWRGRRGVRPCCSFCVACDSLSSCPVPWGSDAQHRHGICGRQFLRFLSPQPFNPFVPPSCCAVSQNQCSGSSARHGWLHGPRSLALVAFAPAAASVR